MDIFKDRFSPLVRMDEWVEREVVLEPDEDAVLKQAAEESGMTEEEGLLFGLRLMIASGQGPRAWSLASEAE